MAARRIPGPLPGPGPAISRGRRKPRPSRTAALPPSTARSSRGEHRVFEETERGVPVALAVGGEKGGVAREVLLALDRVRRQREDAHRARLPLDRDEVEFDEAGLIEEGSGVFADDEVDAVLL